jgi:serine/threonine protein kinase
MPPQVDMLHLSQIKKVKRENFKTDMMLGEGNYGIVWKGKLLNLQHPGSSTEVAIKSVPLGQLEKAKVLVAEMKINGYLGGKHPNLLNMIGWCVDDGQRPWILLEYCAFGDLKNYLVKNRDWFQSNIDGAGNIKEECNASRLVKWAHEIAKGMDYMHSKCIMHGDLAARNILIDTNCTAKVADFGLSKKFMYENVRYKKKIRHEVPWQWMALEFFNDGMFELVSDVWSYGILLWELFSLGREPYDQDAIMEPRETIEKIIKGYRLQMPSEFASSDWAPKVYREVMKPSWMKCTNERITFSTIDAKLEKIQKCGQIKKGCRQSNLYTNPVHKIIKDIKCPYCNYLTYSLTRIADHIIEVHRTIKDMICHLCDFVATSKGRITEHVKEVHDKIKDKKCLQCVYASSRSYDLTRHIKEVHDKIKDKRCLQCDYATSRTNDLTRHIKAVHDHIIGMDCPYCDYVASSNRRITEHVTAVHDRIKDNKRPK